MIYHVKVCGWTPDDWVVIKVFECRYMWSAKLVKWAYELCGYDRVIIE